MVAELRLASCYADLFDPLSPAVVWIAVAVVVLAALLYVIVRPMALVRLVLWVLGHSLYRIRTFGLENVPTSGPALLVCNHVSYIDWLLLLAGQRRFIHFVIFAGWTRVWGLRHLLRWAGVIPIDGSLGPRAIVQSLRQASDALARGELVCIFAEGRFTRTGFLLPFHRGFEQIVKRVSAPIIPVCLDHVWGSIFSFRHGKLIWKWPQELPYPVSVAYGEPMPPTTPAAEVRLAIQKLSANCATERSARRRPVHRQFVRMAARHPFRSCLIDTTPPCRELSYGRLLAGAMIFARRLRPLLGDERMVGVWLPPSGGGAVTNIALALLGKTAVNLNYTSSPEVVGSALRQCGVRHVITSRAFREKVKLEAGPDVALIDLEPFRDLVTKWERIREFLKVILLPGFVLDRWVLGLRRHHPDDIATVIFSSGSTGDPKGVMLSHRNIAANTESMIQAIDPGPRDRLLGILPFFHSFGYTVTLWVPLQVGASMVFHVDPRQAKEIGELSRKYKCTIFLVTPTFLRFCLRRCEPGDFSTMRLIMVGAEKLPPSLAEEFKEKFGVLPMEGYGCTELSPSAIVNVPDQEQEGFRQIGNKPGTIGQPIPGVAARIVNPETFEPLPQGQEGLLLIYGGNVMAGYLGRKEETDKVIRDGWYVTGDLAKYDEDGFVTITGRESRFSKIGGEMVPHEKIENVLHKILGTSERVCIVTAVPDERKGERLIVLHTPLNGTDVRQVWQQLNSMGLPNLWVPGERDFVEIADMPLLGSGKIDLKRAKDLALERTR
jgi:acyl-[acyl-carrier-protein]-phospholipid O-acyltransferase/long-chain-fatty-acid--[acyl-carrier-protein] ligase